MVNELRINALEPAGVALLDQLGIITVKRATLVTGRASAEIAASFEKLHAPVSSFAIPPDSVSDRISSFVKNGLPSVASRSLWARSSETFGAPTSDSTRDLCSEGENGGSVKDTK